MLCVVDVSDFDGSLPRLALRSLLPPGAGDALPDELGFKLMVAVNKFDTLPAQATAARVEQWVRIRLKQAGLPRPDKVRGSATGLRSIPLCPAPSSNCDICAFIQAFEVAEWVRIRLKQAGLPRPDKLRG